MINRTSLLADIENTLGERKTWLSVAETAALTGLHQQTIRQYIYRGDITAAQRTPHGPYRIRFTELNKILRTPA